MEHKKRVQLCELSYYWDRQLEVADKCQDVEDWTYWKVRPPKQKKRK
jgi:hypothetical protein